MNRLYFGDNLKWLLNQTQLSIWLITVLLAHFAIAVEPVGDADFKAGYSVGKSDGEEWAALGQNMPQPVGLDLIANGKSKRLDQSINRESWKLGYKAGYRDGFEDAKRTWRPATANADKYDQPSYWAGYNIGFQSNRLEGDDRTRMFRRIDMEIEKQHYKKDDYGAGFAAGQADADKHDEELKRKKVGAEKLDFEKRSFEAGYRAEKDMHKHNGVPRTIEEAIKFDEDAKKWDSKSWSAGYRKGKEEDTRP
jgi:hypothetical protein